MSQMKRAYEAGVLSGGHPQTFAIHYNQFRG